MMKALNRKEKRAKSTKKKLIFLILFCISFSVFFQLILYHRTQKIAESSSETEIFLDTEDLEILDSLVEESDFHGNPSEFFTEELDVLREEIIKFRSSTVNMSERDREKQIVAIWDRELTRLSQFIEEELGEEEKQSFLDSQAQFRRLRRQECLNLSRSAEYEYIENLVYLTKYSELTENRCL